MIDYFLIQIGAQQQMQWKGDDPQANDDGDGLKNSCDTDWKDYGTYRQFLNEKAGQIPDAGSQQQMQWKGGDPDGDDDKDRVKNNRDTDWKDYEAYTDYKNHIKQAPSSGKNSLRLDNLAGIEETYKTEAQQDAKNAEKKFEEVIFKQDVADAKLKGDGCLEEIVDNYVKSVGKLRVPELTRADINKIKSTSNPDFDNLKVKVDELSGDLVVTNNNGNLVHRVVFPDGKPTIDFK
jgi:hypothetical protein